MTTIAHKSRAREGTFHPAKATGPASRAVGAGIDGGMIPPPSVSRRLDWWSVFSCGRSTGFIHPDVIRDVSRISHGQIRDAMLSREEAYLKMRIAANRLAHRANRDDLAALTALRHRQLAR